MKKALMTASVVSMIDQFNMNNIMILKDMGYEVHVACNFIEGNTSNNERIEKIIDIFKELNIKIYQIPLSRKIYKFKQIIKSYKLLKELGNKHNYDIVHCHSPIGGAITRLALSKNRKRGTKIIYTAHGFHFFKGAPLLNWIIYYPIECLLARDTDTLITINKEDYHYAQKMKAKKIKYVPGIGIDVKKFTTPTGTNDIYTELNLPLQSLLLLSVGELNKNKNHKIVIKALAEVNNSKIYYLLCGIGKYKKKLDKIAHNLGVHNQVKFLGFRTDIPKIYSIADLFIIPSRREGLSVALLEAMASGLPCIGSNIRGNKDLIYNGKNGFLIKVNDSKGLAEKINILINNNKLCDEMCTYNKKIIYKFSNREVEKKMKMIYMDK